MEERGMARQTRDNKTEKREIEKKKRITREGRGGNLRGRKGRGGKLREEKLMEWKGREGKRN